ncbi:DUF1028 domain-containing protein [Candidatus Poribacteria bacterium]|nr:DUF1028 domain-containing protein [Candidatus Poribacteria bacterium]
MVQAAADSSPETIATFSIVGYDPETGELGVAVQSKFFAVGSVVPCAKAGVGAIASQAFGNTTFGPRGLKLLEEGLTVQETLDLLLATDPDREHRQVGIVDAQGNSAAFSGTMCMPWAGHISGKNFTAQGNILVGRETVEAMAKAFEETEGMLGEKLLRALEEGQKAGGDSRGMQSAAILIVKEKGGYAGFNDRYCDLRVDDHAEPIKELRRIFNIWKINALINEGYRLCESGEWERAFSCGAEAVKLDPASGDPHYHLGCYYSKAGKTAEALTNLEEAVKRNPKLAAQALEDPDFESLSENPEFKRVTSANSSQ